MAAREDKNDGSVEQFYSGKTVFLTGCTGFVGKVLLEKLLYSCRSVKCIYVLVREKKGIQGSERIEQLIKSPVFAGPNRIPQNVLRDKIVPLYGDLTVAGLGLSDQHRAILVNQVNIILHCAASVHFDDPVKEALKINFLGTKSIADLCREMYRLEAFVHVSTCYSNCHLDEVDEKIYKTKMTGEQLMDMSSWMESDKLDKFAEDNLYEGRPNSYVFTKSLAENYVFDKCQGLPVAIARLPIVVPALQEPEPGFVDTAGAGNFVGLVTAVGAIRTYDFDPDITQEYQGVDTSSHAIILAAMDVAKCRADRVKIFNVALGCDNHLPLGQVLGQMKKTYVHDITTFKAFRPMIDISRKPYRLEFVYKKYVMEYFYAFLFDLVMIACGKKSFALKKMVFVSKIRESLYPFNMKTFKFYNDNFKNLNNLLTDKDKKTFHVDCDKLISYLGSEKGYGELLHNSALSYLKNKFNDTVTPESVPKRRAHVRKLKLREATSVIVIHSLLAAMLYFIWLAASYVCQLVF